GQRRSQRSRHAPRAVRLAAAERDCRLPRNGDRSSLPFVSRIVPHLSRARPKWTAAKDGSSHVTSVPILFRVGPHGPSRSSRARTLDDKKAKNANSGLTNWKSVNLEGQKPLAFATKNRSHRIASAASARRRTTQISSSERSRLMALIAKPWFRRIGLPNVR